MKTIILRVIVAGLTVVFLSMSTLGDDGKKQRSPGIDENVEVDEFPVPTKQIAPTYPPAAKAKGIEGTVYVKVLVGTDGVPRDARVIRSDAAQLDSASRATLLQWRFKPATKKGSAVEVWVVVPIKYALSKDNQKPAQK